MAGPCYALCIPQVFSSQASVTRYVNVQYMVETLWYVHLGPHFNHLFLFLFPSNNRRQWQWDRQ